MSTTTEVKGIKIFNGLVAKVLQPFDTADFDGLQLEGQLNRVYKPTWGGKTPSPLARGLLSYTRAKVPIQVPLGDSDIQSLMQGTTYLPSLTITGDGVRWMCSRDEVEKRVPYKPNPVSMTKANVYFNEVADDLRRMSPLLYSAITPYSALLVEKGFTNDQLTAHLMWSAALHPRWADAARWTTGMLLDLELMKEVSSFIKAVGANSTPLGAMVVEGQSILGRGVGDFNARSEAEQRCDAEWVSSKIVNYDEDLLRTVIRSILRDELRQDDGSHRAEYPSLSQHWEKRWLWAVNGAHSRIVDPSLREQPRAIEGAHRIHRRAFLESIRDDPRPDWDGTTLASVSAKEEHGKTRAIFACDTITYLAFEHLLGTVEKRWRGRRVVLNPGKGGNLGMAVRVAACRARSGISLMLDYDDFNSHHSTRAMQILFEELALLTGYPDDLAAKLVASFDNTHIYNLGQCIGKSAGTLMSGHRGTTFINSVLNMAYLCAELGYDYFKERTSMHVGDDVYVGVQSYKDAAHIVSRLQRSGLRLNRSKQSVGHVSTEFLRTASRGRDSIGYLTRSIASVVSGNWTTERVLQPMEALNSILNSARSLANRSQWDDMPLLLASAARRTLRAEGLDDGLLRDILTGRCAVNDGPQFHSSGTHVWVKVKEISRRVIASAQSRLPVFATAEFLEKGASAFEHSVLMKAGVSVWDEMVASSFTKSLNLQLSEVDGLTFSSRRHRPAVGSVTAERLLPVRPEGGVLLKYPLLVLAKGHIEEPLLREAVSWAGGNGHAENIKEEAWGVRSQGCIVRGRLSYSDGAMLAKRTKASVIVPLRDCYI